LLLIAQRDVSRLRRGSLSEIMEEDAISDPWHVDIHKKRGNDSSYEEGSDDDISGNKQINKQTAKRQPATAHTGPESKKAKGDGSMDKSGRSRQGMIRGKCKCFELLAELDQHLKSAERSEKEMLLIKKQRKV
jgi:hypothetical protein